MTRGRCCCERGCILFTDNFNRADSLTLGRFWYEPLGHDSLEIHGYCPNGTPTLAHGAVRAPFGGDPGAAIWERRHPRQSAYMQGRIYTLDDYLLWGTNLTVELLLGVEYDPVTHDIGAMHVAQFTLGETPFITLLARDGLDGSTIELASEEIGGLAYGDVDDERGLPCDLVFRRLFVATLTSRAFCASVSNATLSLVQANPDWSLYGETLDRHYSGFGVSSIEAPADPKELHVDNWALWDVFDNNSLCPLCACGCDAYVMPHELTITAHGTGCMAPIEGQSTTLAWNRLTLQWTGTLTTACAEWDIILGCPAVAPPFTVENFGLQIQGTCHNSDPCHNAQRKASPGSTCDPLDLFFGSCGGTPGGGGDCDHDGWWVAYSDLACFPCCPPDLMKSGYQGCYWFEVTE